MTDSFHGIESAIYGAGYDLKPFLKSAKISGARGQYDSSALADIVKTFRAGRVSGEFSGEGFHSTGAGEFSAISTEIDGTKQVMMLAPEGNVAGGVFGGTYGTCVSRGIDSKLTEMTMALVNVKAKTGADLGYMLTTGKQNITATGFSAAVDTLAANARGGSFYAQCLAYTGTAGKLVFGLEDSADNVTFSAITSTIVPTAEIITKYNKRIPIAAGISIKRYVRMYWTVTAGLTSADIVGGFCKYYT